MNNIDSSYSYMLDIVEDLYKSSENNVPTICSVCRKEYDEDEGDNNMCSTCVTLTT